MTKQLLTYCLLFAFVVIYTPRSIWHSHAEKKENKCSHDDGHNHSDTDEDCYVCDFTLQPALTPVSFQFKFPHPDNYIAPATAISLVDLSESGIQYLRGPPVEMIV